MFETSKDILNLVLALGVLVIAALLGWLLFYIVSMVRDVRQATKTFKEKIEMIDGILSTLKDKIEKSASYFSILVELVSKLVTHFRQDRNDRPRRGRKFTDAEIVDDDE